MKFRELRLSRDFVNIIIFNFQTPRKTLKSPLFRQCGVCMLLHSFLLLPFPTKYEIGNFILHRAEVQSE